MKKLILLFATIAFTGSISAQNNFPIKSQISNGLNSPNIESLSPSDYKKIKATSSGVTQAGANALVTAKTVIVDDSTKLPLSPNGKLISVDGFEVDFLVPSKPEISNICYTPSPVVNGSAKNASCPFTVPCDDPSNRDVSSYTTQKYVQLVWHVMWNGGASSNIDQARIDDLMAELNADYATHNVIFCADPASFYEDPANYDHDSNTEEWQLKDLYNVTPTDVCNIYVVGDMTAGGYARFPYDPNGGTDAHGGIVLNRGNCSVGTHTLAHEMGHTFGLEHTFAGVDERTECSSCYERVRNANGSSNASGAATALGGPYLDQGDREGDWCSDTNPHDTYSYNCSTSSNSNGACDSGPWANAPVNNHMSYSFCSSQFTNQQDRRMHCMLDSYLGTWTAYGGGLCGAQPPVADFVGTPTTWQAPSNVNFTDLSTPQAIITGWTWTFDVGASATVTCAGCVGASATFVGQVPPAVTYPNPGLYTVSLTVTSANGPDTETKIDYIEVLAPAGDCDTLDTQWENPTPTPSIYTFGGGYLTGVQDPANSLLPTDLKGVYEMYFTPNPGVTQVGAARVGLGFLQDADDDMVIQVLVFDDDGFGAPGALLGGVGGISPTALGVPGAGFFNEFWIPFNNAVTPTTGTFHVGVEMIPGDATDSMLVVSSAAGEGEGDFSTHIWTTGFGYENMQAVYGIDYDHDIIPMLGEYAPLPLITGFTENVVCDTTYVTLFDTALYSSVSSWSFTFADGTVINSITDPMTIDRVYTTPGPDTVTISVINDCGRGDTTTWIIPYGFLETPDAEFTASPLNPVCMGAPGVDFTADVPGYVDYSWDFGDGTVITSSGNIETINHIYTVPGTYYVELTTTQAGYNAADTFYLEDFEGGWPAGYDRYDNDPFTPNAAVNPPFDGTNPTAWLPLDADGDGSVEATSTSWNGGPGQPADDWMLTTGIGALPANQRLFWDGEALDVSYPDGYEVRISTVQLPATVGNYSTLLYSTTAENAFNTTHSVDLASYAGQVVYIAFRNTSDDMFLLAIDNIRVGTATPGCDASILKTDFVEVVDCTVLPPVAVLNSDVTGGCGPLTVTFTDATVAGDPAVSWLWNFGDGTFSTDQNPVPHVYATAGSYYVIFESCNTGGCTQDTITIFVGDPATLTSVVTVDPTCANNDGSITINATGGTGTLQYSIDAGVTFQASNVFNGLAAGTYDVVVEDAIGCQVTSTEILVAAAGPSITLVTPTDPLCLGGIGGTIVITASGGTGALTYSVDNGVTFQAGNNFAGLGAGTYDIVVEDASGCQATQTVILLDGVSPTIDGFTTVDVLCNGDLTGSINITASGGTGVIQYQYDANPFQASNIITGLGAGSYSITIEDANGCQATLTPVIIAQPASAVSITGVVNTDPSCNGLLDGDITITATGGTGVITYSIDNGVTFQAGNSFAGLGAGTYNIVVEDANGCQATSSIILIDPAAVSISGVVTVDPTCVGNDGSIDITATGGTGALTYSIDNGVTFQAGNTFVGLNGASYDIVVEDANGCQATSSVILTPSLPPTITIVNSTDPLCSGGLTGTIDITASGGTGALTYSIDNGVTFQAGNTFAGLGAGTYDIVVEDVNGCQATSSVILVDPVVVVITAVTTVDPTCAGGDGSIDITASGGTGALTYSIDNGVTFQAGNTFAALSAGTYNIVVEDANGCQVTSIATLTASGGPSITSVVVTDPTCAGGTNGDITITATGTATILYSIDNGVTFQAGNNFTGLGAGVYNIVVEDGLGCQTTSLGTLVDPTAVAITLISSTDPTCNAGLDGDITITASGGTGALTYSIDNGVTFQAGNLFTGLGAGAYNIVVEDANGCQATGTATLVNPAVITYTVTITDENCGLADGQIDLVGAGGDGGPYNYSIDNGVTFQGSGTFPGLTVGPYNVVIEDGLGCQTISVETVSGTGGPSITLINEDISLLCNGDCNGQLTATVTGGVLPYLFEWVDGASAPVGGNTATVNGLCADSYVLTVTDANGAGCPTVLSYTLGEPTAVTYIATVTDESCGTVNGQIDITGAAGGSGAGYQYSVDNGITFQAGGIFAGLGANTYNVVVEDGNGCQATSIETVLNIAGPTITGVVTTDPTCGGTNGDITITATGGTGAIQYSIDNGVTFQAGNNFTGLTATLYDVVVEDANGCQTTSTVTLTDLGAPIITSATPTDPTCGNANGDITIVASGGTGVIQYSIDNGVTFQAGGFFPGLIDATYDVVIEDANGCQAFQSVTLVNSTPPVITNVVAVDPACGNPDGTIDITASGGTGALQYSIDNGVTFQAGNTFAGLGAGTYDIIVEDANGCQAISTATLVSVASPTITSVTIIDPTCGNANGDITILATGGVGALQYSIDNGITFQAGSNFTGLTAAVYDVVVEDANGCQAVTTSTLVDLGAPTITSVVTVDASCGNPSGEITITGAGGTGALTYSIDNGATFQASGIFLALIDATYDVVVEDANGCQATQTVVILNSAAPTITTITTVDPSCGNPNGTIDITATGGTPALQYSIDGGVTYQASNVFTGLGAGTYAIVVDDANGCKAFGTAVLNASALPSITGVTVVDPTCGNINGDITINATGGVGALQYSIDNGATFQAGNTFTGLAPAVYNIVVEDANGCQASSVVTLVDAGPPSISSVGATDPSCGATNGTITIIGTGGTGTIQYSIDGGATFQASNSFNGLAGATYNIMIEDANGCQDVSSAVLVDAGSPVITSVIETDGSCGNDNGSISINVTGGAPVIQYSIDNGVTFSTNSNFSGLGFGAYNIVVQDGNGCQVTSSASIGQAGSPVITIDNIVDLDCYSDADGQVNITVTGGVGPYTYDWSNDGSGDWDDPEDLTNGIPGVVSVTVMDANGCAVLTTATIGGPGNLSALGFGSDATFGNDGSIDLIVSGGTAPLTFDWSNGSTVEDPTGLAGNTTYTVVITDANGCTFTLDVFVGSIVSVPELDNPMEISVYPNPNNGVFSIDFENYSGDATVEVVDITGKLVYLAMQMVNPEISIDVDLGAVASGVYFVNVSGEFDKYSIRVMKK